MKIMIDVPDVIVKLIETQAIEDGHKNKSAVVRKALNKFFSEKVSFVSSCHL